MNEQYRHDTMNIAYYIEHKNMLELLDGIITRNKSSRYSYIEYDKDINKLKSEWSTYTRKHGNCDEIGIYFKLDDYTLRYKLSILCESKDRRKGNYTIGYDKIMIQKFACDNTAVEVLKSSVKNASTKYVDRGDILILVRNDVDCRYKDDYIVAKIGNFIYSYDLVREYINRKVDCTKDNFELPELKLVRIYNAGIDKRKLSNKEYFDKCIHNISKNIDNGVSKKEILSTIKDIISKHDIELLDKYFKSNELEKFETVARRIYNDAFIRLIDYKLMAHMDISKESKDYYYKLTKKKINNVKHREEEYRHPVKRGILENNKGDVINGGCNKRNQTNINIKMNDSDFEILCEKFNIMNPTQSQLNDIIEDVLKAKFESNEQYTLRKKARLAVLYHRDRNKQSRLSRYKACYIPCEYNAYITEIQRINYKTENFKNSKTFVLSVILHEYIGYV